MSVRVRNHQRRVSVSLPRLRHLASRTLAAVGRMDRDVDVSVVDDREIARVNARYLRHRRPTDVIAFNLEGAPGSRLLGEVMISAETAERQSQQVGVSVALELDLLLVHGLLHLAGYDDRDPHRAMAMHERARAILSGRTRHRVPARLWTGLLPTQ